MNKPLLATICKDSILYNQKSINIVKKKFLKFHEVQGRDVTDGLLMGLFLVALVATCMSVSQDITGIEASGWDCMVLNAAGTSDWRFKNRRGSPVKNSLSLNGVSMIRRYWIFNWSFIASDSLSARRRCSTSVVVGQFWFSSKSSGFVCLFVWSFDYLTLVEQSFVGCQLLLNDVERSLSFLTVFTSQSQSFTADRFQRF